ncbi:transcription termination factor Rho [Calycomorphotria hydatis]|uniref:Transcription termination factor Rho n=1 Tax=Calycomorphotria hydatis TaxID=2528027 RepID=A0A517TCW3_9PLAN|nr:transcription termination factor Rho [Calycomorphotria hydatis]QDT66211.1 hypothetical protein V22_34760 [Calycomorphotria hydatis]
MGSASPSESTDRKTPRRRTRHKTKSESEDVSTSTATADNSDDFGDGIVFEEVPSLPKRRKKPATRKKKEVEESFDDDSGSGDSGDVVSEAPRESYSEDSAPSNSSSDEGSDQDGDGQQRRRRRRRRRGPGGGNNGGHNNQRGGQQNNRGGGGRGQRPNQRRNRMQSSGPPPEEVIGDLEGILELHPKGYGFLRDPSNNYCSRDTDAFVSSSLIEKYKLREGVLIKGEVGPGSKGQGPRLKTIESVDGRDPEDYAQIKHFDHLTPINPFEQIVLERGASPVTVRVMDLLTPIGKGQRALLVAPPRSGKTMLLQDIAQSVTENHPEVHLIMLLIDERPEEVTEMRRCVTGEVVASSLDREVESHVRVSQLVIERAKRLAEEGKDVLVLLDSITRLARAFNKWVGNSGRTGTGGLDIRALDIPKKLFGTARRFEEGGSLTVVGTALVETGGRMDDAIFQEFKGTGNMELVLSRELADRRIWPAIDIAQSGTRREEKILAPEVLDGVTMLRRSLISLSPVQAMEDLTRTLGRFPSNADFISRVKEIL